MSILVRVVDVTLFILRSYTYIPIMSPFLCLDQQFYSFCL